MKVKNLGITGLALLGLCLAFSPASAGDSPEIKEFWKVWRGKKSTNLEKNSAVDALLGGEELAEPYLEILESDTWQYRATVVGRIQGETNKELLAALEEFLFNEKKVIKRPSAAEHLVWAMFNNSTWATAEKWNELPKLVEAKKVPDKVKARILRELGVFRGATDLPEVQALARQNVMILVDMLKWALNKKSKANPNLRFLIGDALESLTSQDFGDDLDQWEFFANGLKADTPLEPRKAAGFKDEFENVEIEGHSYSSPKPRPVELELLVLSDLGKSDRYWYPYIFELNKTFKCTFVKLPDCSRMPDIEWLKDRNGQIDRSAYYYPLKQMVDAFEQRRKASKQKRIGLIAHGVSGWIALEYLRAHPESVAFAVIMQTWSGALSRERSRNAMEQQKDDAFKNAGKNLIYDPTGRIGSLSLNDEEKFYANTGSFKRRWADPRAFEPIMYAQKAWREQPQGSARIIVPDWNFEKVAKRTSVDVPVLFINGTNDPMYPTKDEKIYNKTFTKMMWKDFKESADTPWAEEPVNFFASFNEMLEKHKVIEKLKEEAEEAAEEAKKNGE